MAFAPIFADGAGSAGRIRARTRSAGRAIAALAVVAPLLAAASLGGADAAAAAEKASLRLKWLPQAQFAGFYVAKAKGFYEAEGIDLTINPGGPNLNAEALVASGADTFGLSGGVESHLAAVDKGMSLVAIGVAHQKTPYAFVTYPDSGINTLEDFKGRKVSTWYSGSQYTLKAMLATAGITESDLTIMPQSVSMNPFIDREVDVATATLYNELNTLKARGLTDLKIFQPDDYGIVVQRDTLITTAETIKDKPELVQGFFDATVKGWKYALQHKDEAVDILLKVDPGMDRKHQEAMIDTIEDVMIAGKGASDGMFFIDYDTLQKQHDILLAAGVMKNPVDLKTAFDPSFWEKAPVDDKKL